MIVVFGSNVLDLFFQQENLPPKDKALFLDSHVEAPGGKGANQAIAAARAGSEVRFYGALGEGGHGRQMYKNLAKNNIDVSGIEFVDTPSGLATIFVDETDGTHRIVVSQGANLKARQATIPDDKLEETGTIVLVQGEVPIQETEDLLVRAKAKGARTVMNFAPAIQPLSDRLLKNLDILIMNEYEAESLGKMLDIPAEDKVAFAQAIYTNYQTVAVVTLGPKGSLMVSGETILAVPSLNITPVDTVGAGDAHAGYFCAALDQGEDMETALRWASVAGSTACTRLGAQVALPEKAEALQKLDEVQVFTPQKAA